jgi:DNA-binding beta-propeller fold protein YncE
MVGTILKFTPGGAVSTFATGLYYPEYLAFDSAGNLYASTGNSIDEITPSGTVSTFATGLDSPNGLAFDGSGNLYVANYFGGTISEITPSGTVSTFATAGLDLSGLAFGPAPTPEPSSVALLASAAGLLLLRPSRRGGR